jgi:hypothetical protein
MTIAKRTVSIAISIFCIACLPAQPVYPQTVSSIPLEATLWKGSYSCAQGPTGLRLTTQSTPQGTVNAKFEFGPNKDVDNIPSGSFRLSGSIRSTDGFLQLNPVDWIFQPPGYNMVGLRGFVSGEIYRGSVIAGTQCGEFAVSRGLTTVAPGTPSGAIEGSMPPGVCAQLWQNFRDCEADAQQQLQSCAGHPRNMGPCPIGSSCFPPACQQ